MFVSYVHAGFMDSIKSGVDEGKRILNGDPKIENIPYLNSIKSEGSLSSFMDTSYQFEIQIYNNSTYVITKVNYELDINGDKYSGEFGCGEIHPKTAGSCKGFVNIFKMASKWSYSVDYYGYSLEK